MSAHLDLLDPQKPIPTGWLEGTFVPAVAEETDWDVFDEVERRINALIGYLDQNQADKAVLQAALRAVEIRRGLLDDASRACDASRQTRLRWRRLAEYREVLWPELVEAAREGNAAKTTQRYCLRLVVEHTPARLG